MLDFACIESESERLQLVLISGQYINYTRFIKLAIHYGICLCLLVLIHEKSVLQSPFIYQTEDGDRDVLYKNNQCLRSRKTAIGRMSGTRECSAVFPDLKSALIFLYMENTETPFFIWFRIKLEKKPKLKYLHLRRSVDCARNTTSGTYTFSIISSRASIKDIQAVHNRLELLINLSGTQQLYHNHH